MTYIYTHWLKTQTGCRAALKPAAVKQEMETSSLVFVLGEDRSLLLFIQNHREKGWYGGSARVRDEKSVEDEHVNLPGICVHVSR